MREIYVKFYHKGKENAVDFIKKMKLFRTLPQNKRGYILTKYTNSYKRSSVYNKVTRYTKIQSCES
jgi:hypothetical protein